MRVRPSFVIFQVLHEFVEPPGIIALRHQPYLNGVCHPHNPRRNLRIQLPHNTHGLTPRMRNMPGSTQAHERLRDIACLVNSRTKSSTFKVPLTYLKPVGEDADVVLRDCQWKSRSLMA